MSDPTCAQLISSARSRLPNAFLTDLIGSTEPAGERPSHSQAADEQLALEDELLRQVPTQFEEQLLVCERLLPPGRAVDTLYRGLLKP